ncbi:MAG: glutathione S-transferase family protein [Pseudomonadota bacterium]
MNSVSSTGFLIGIVLLVVVFSWFLLEKRRRRTHPVKGGIDRSITLTHTHEVELYSNSFSHCSRKTRLVLAELGINTKHHSIELIETGWYQTISAEYLKINPSGLVPTLVHEGHPIFESDDILAYAQSIAAIDAPQLVPEDPELRTRMHEWLSFCAISSEGPMDGMAERAGACIPGLSLPMFVSCIQYVPLRKILIGFLFHPDKKRPALFTASKLLGLRRMMTQKNVVELMHSSRDHMRVHLQTLEQALSQNGQPWILGNAYSLADVTLSCVLLRLEETGWLTWFEETTNLEHVSSYYQRLKKRPSWPSAIYAHGHPVVTEAMNYLQNTVAADPSMLKLIYGSSPSQTV